MKTDLSATIFYHDPDTNTEKSWVTSLNPACTDEAVRDYFKVGSTANIGKGPEDYEVTITKVEIHRELST